MLTKILNFTFFSFLGVVAFTFLLPTNAYSELFSHFARLCFFITLVYVVIYARHANKKLIALALSACVLTAWPLLYSFESVQIPRKDPLPQEDVSILQCNIHYKNENPWALTDRLREQGFPDIVVLQEVTPEIWGVLTYLKEEYPYTYEAPESGAYGMVVLSKIPIVTAHRKAFRNTSNEYAVIQFVT